MRRRSEQATSGKKPIRRGLSKLLDARLEQELRRLRAGNAELVNYANTFEVLLARAACEGFSRDQIEETRLALLKERGGFDTGLVWTPPDPVFAVAHEVPGRLRFVAAKLRGDWVASEDLAARVGSLNGVISAETKPITGSLIVYYDGAPATRTAVIRALEEFSCAPVRDEWAYPPLHRARHPSMAGGTAKALQRGVQKAAEGTAEQVIQGAAEWAGPGCRHDRAVRSDPRALVH